jgi:DNA-binding transcriptional LysR family regulator
LKSKVGKTIRLTPAGKQLAKLAREHLHSLEEFQRTCRQQPKEVVIGAGDSLLQWLASQGGGTLFQRRLEEIAASLGS